MTGLSPHLRYWAKTSPDDPDQYHPVLYHCLDVAATGRALLEHRPRSLARLSTLSGLAGDVLIDLVTLLLSFHDLGKMADGFQGLVPPLMVRLQGRTGRAAYGGTVWRHDTVGYVALDRLLREDGLAGLLPADARIRRTFSETWLSAVMGHHGVPPVLDIPRHRAGFAQQFPTVVHTDVVATITDLREVLLPEGLPGSWVEDWPRRFGVISWLLTGLAVVADWIGSSSTWFAFSNEDYSTARYFDEVALPSARVAVAAAGQSEPREADRMPFVDLWRGYEPTPLQRLVDEIPLAEGAQLFIVEEVTGGGKTEAAFTLAHRLIAAGRAEGLYVGLPTMATANAMYDRLTKVYRRLYADDAKPSLTLAHSRRDLRLALEQAVASPPSSSDDQLAETASDHCARWLADSRKKALLADVGIGTVDQALLAVLQARHQSLRLWGLAGKVLVVDEVHAADAYMQGLLAGLLEAHAAFGGCAILLSATLAGRQRAALCRAFVNGSHLDATQTTDRSYPALLHLSRDRLEVFPLEARREASRQIAVRLLHNVESVDEQIGAALAVGHCACWIRNTVSDAVAAWERWARLVGEDRVLLFHARFTVDDREAIERDVVRRFGPESGAVDRTGRLVIATQVVEQSLDLDFDLLVTDLAPADLLVQRAGRLRRHRRDERGERIGSADRRGEPVLYVLSPPPVDDCGADWLAGFLPGAAAIYPDHGALWLGARWLADNGRIAVPDDLRELIEHVYSGDAFDQIPSTLQTASLAAEGQARADSSVAGVNRIAFAQGYRPSGGTSSWRNDVKTPTRLGEPTTTLRLARVVDAEVRPWHDDGEYPWSRSEVSIGEAQVYREWPDDQPLIEQAKAGMPDQGRYGLVALLRPQDGEDGLWTGRAIDRWERPKRLAYSAQRGLLATTED